MNISKQKRILYIPIINFSVIMFSWLRLYYKNNIPKIRFVKNVIKIFIVCLIITIPRILIDKITDVLVVQNLSLWISTVIYTFIPSYFALRDQESYAKEIMDKE